MKRKRTAEEQGGGRRTDEKRGTGSPTSKSCKQSHHKDDKPRGTHRETTDKAPSSSGLASSSNRQQADRPKDNPKSSYWAQRHRETTTTSIQPKPYVNPNQAKRSSYPALASGSSKSRDTRDRDVSHSSSSKQAGGSISLHGQKSQSCTNNEKSVINRLDNQKKETKHEGRLQVNAQ